MTDSHEPQPIRKNPSYYRKEPIVVTEKMREEIRQAFAEIDMEEIEILRKMTPIERYRRACDMELAAHKAAVSKLLQQNPDLDEDEAWRLVRSGEAAQYNQDDSEAKKLLD